LTNNDNKDHDTGIYVSVTTADGTTTLATIQNADNCANCEYKDHTPHTINLIINAPGAQEDACRGFVVELGIVANGNDSWKIDEATVTLIFTDQGGGQTNLRATKKSFDLNSRGSSYVSTRFNN
jgi:hypothetical protein